MEGNDGDVPPPSPAGRSPPARPHLADGPVSRRIEDVDGAAVRRLDLTCRKVALILLGMGSTRAVLSITMQVITFLRAAEQHRDRAQSTWSSHVDLSTVNTRSPRAPADNGFHAHETQAAPLVDVIPADGISTYGVGATLAPTRPVLPKVGYGSTGAGGYPTWSTRPDPTGCADGHTPCQ